MAVYDPDLTDSLVATLSAPSKPGDQRLPRLLGRDGDLPVVLDHRGRARTLAPGEPYKIVPPAEAADFDLQTWQRQTRAALDAAAAEAQRAELHSALLEGLHSGFVVPEAIDSATPRENAMRREILEASGGEGICRRVGRKRGCWVLAQKTKTFTPEPAGVKLLVVGAEGLADGEHVLIGWVDKCPAVLTWPFAQAPRVRVVRDGRWRRPGAESPERWLAMTREAMDREGLSDPDDVRAQLLDRLIEERAVTPTEGERVGFEVLRAEGFARLIGDVYVLAVKAEGDA